MLSPSIQKVSFLGHPVDATSIKVTKKWSYSSPDNKQKNISTSPGQQWRPHHRWFVTKRSPKCPPRLRGSSWSENHPISPPLQLRGRKHGWAEFILLEFQRLRLAIIIPYLSLLGISPSISIRTMGWLRLLPSLFGLLFTFVGHKHVFLQEPFQDFCQFHCPFHREEVWFGFKS